MKRPIHLKPEDYGWYDVLKYRVGKWLDNEIPDALDDAIVMINRNERDNPSLGGLADTAIDDIVYLPGGSYVRVRWELEVVDPAEIEEMLSSGT